MADKQGVKLFLIDSFQMLFPDEDASFTSRSEELEDNLRRIKEIAVTLHVTVILLTNIRRPTRKNYSGPTFIDRDTYCPSAEDHADTIILLHRDILGLNMDEESLNLVELRVVRNRNGATGTVDLFSTERDSGWWTPPNKTKNERKTHHHPGRARPVFLARRRPGEPGREIHLPRGLY